MSLVAEAPSETLITSPVSVWCEYPHSPGYTWRAEVTFSPRDRGGFIVTDTNDADGLAGAHRIVGTSTVPLTWRSAATWLEGQTETGLGGDLLAWVRCDDLPPWQGFMLGWAWSVFDRPHDQLYGLLRNADDDLLAHLLGDAEPEALARDLELLWLAAEKLDLLDGCLADLWRGLGVGHRPGHLSWLALESVRRALQ